MISVKCGPEWLGHPVHRLRVLGVCINRSKFAWAGSADPESEFKSLFYKAVMVSGAEYFCSPESERIAMYHSMAKVQRNFMTPDLIKTMSANGTHQLLTIILPQGQMQSLLNCLVAQVESAISRKGGPRGHWLVDLEQTEQRHIGGMLWPCQLTHGVVALIDNASHVKIATVREHVGAQGVSVNEAVAPTSPLLPLFLKLHQASYRIYRIPQQLQ